MIRMILAGSLLGIHLFAASIAMACTCVQPAPPQTALENATAVFVGEVVRIQRLQQDQIPFLRVTLRVNHIVKGALSQTVEVLTVDGEVGCGFPFQRGRRYFVYAHAADTQGTLHVSLCSRTARLEDANEDLAAFNVPELIFEDDGGGCGGGNLAIFQAVLFILIGLTFYRPRRV